MNPFAIIKNAINNQNNSITKPNTKAILSSVPQQPKRVYYSIARYDRSGSVIQDMLKAHAFAFGKNMTYGRACVRCSKMKLARQRKQPTQALLKNSSLDTILPYQCPPNLAYLSNNHLSTNYKSEIFSKPKWKQYLLSERKNKKLNIKYDHPSFIKIIEDLH